MGEPARLVRRPPKPRVGPGGYFTLHAAALYRAEYSSKPPQPGDQSMMNLGQVADFRAAVQAALKRGAISFADARSEFAVLDAAREFLRSQPGAAVPVVIGDEPFRIREPRKSSSKVKRKGGKKRKRRKR